MATHRLPIINAFTKPDNNGDTYFEPAAINFGVNDRYNHMVIAFTDQAAKEGIGGKFVVPKNYVGTPSIVVIWATTAITGDVVWDFDYTAVATDAESLDPAADQEAVTVTDTAKATARQSNTSSMSLTAANLAVDDEVLFNLSRDGINAADTLAATAWIFSAFFQYNDV